MFFKSLNGKCRLEIKFIVLLTLTLVNPLFAEVVTEIFTYQSSISSDRQGPLDLKAKINYDDQKHLAPAFVVMHGFSFTSGLLDSVQNNSTRLVKDGFFTISVAMRQRDGSDGKRDSGGVEIYDIYDAVEAAKKQYPLHMDPENISIIGFSGGGGNVMSALTKFPDYFRLGAAFFGISDYGFDTKTGWFFNGAKARHQNILINDIGDPSKNDPAIIDKYAARASNLASKNNPYSEIHFFVNENETVCPPINFISYINNANANQSFKNQFNNIHLHIGRENTCTDFNDNGKCEPDEMQWFPHGYLSDNIQSAAHKWYRQRLFNGKIPQPVLNDSDELYVAGFVHTKKFNLFIGDGQNAAADLSYNLKPEKKEFKLVILTSDKTKSGKLTVNTEDMQGKNIDIYLNRKLVETISATKTYTFKNLKDNQNLSIKLAK